MRGCSLKPTVVILAVILLSSDCDGPEKISGPFSAENLTIEEIRDVLLDNPPNTGDAAIREECLLALDNIFTSDSASTAQSVREFYIFMIEKAAAEIQSEVVEGATIWMMYNHGFVVKTPEVLFAFDLKDGYEGWGGVEARGWGYQLPAELVSQIDVLFVSHGHGDHNDRSVQDTVMANGGYVVYPPGGWTEGLINGNVPIEAGDNLMLSGLKIKAHEGDHGEGTPVRMFEVTTPGGFKILHTGDNQISTMLPEVDSLDVLLLRIGTMDSGWTSSVVGMRECIDMLNPAVMIPGHFNELGHRGINRWPYASGLEVDDEPLAADVQVMTWGERYSITGVP